TYRKTTNQGVVGSNPAGRATFQRLGGENQVLILAVGLLWNLLSTGPCGIDGIQALRRRNQVLLSCCGTVWDPFLHVRVRCRRRVTRSAYLCDREADSPVSAGGQRRHSHNDRPLND